MVEIDLKELRRQLAKPINGYRWRLQQTKPKDARKPYPPGTRGMFMAYIDARDLYDRLDDVFGIGGWSRTVKQVNADGSVVGCLSVNINGEWVIQEDIGYSNDPGAAHEKEPLKAAASDAFKRAGVGLGIGRFLYEMDSQWVDIDEWGKPLRPLSGGHVDVEPNEIHDAPGDTPFNFDSTRGRRMPAESAPDVPPRSRSTSTNTIPASADVPVNLDDAWTMFWAEARRAGLTTPELVQQSIGDYAGDPVGALQRLRAKVSGQPSAMTPTINPPPSQEPARNPATPRQIKFIEAVAREHGMSHEQLQAELAQLYGRELPNIDRRDASAYIEQLQTRRNVTELAS